MCSCIFILVSIVALSCEAAYVRKIERFNIPFEAESMLLLTVMGHRPHECPYECNEIGEYPEPYSCRSYFICNNITENSSAVKDNVTLQPSNNENRNGSNDWCPSMEIKTKNGILPTEYCTCPDGSYWGGPSAGCIDDNSKDMEACCSFKPRCYRYEGEGGNFNGCSLSGSEYNYTCYQDDYKPMFHFEKCRRPNKTSNECLPANLHDVNLKINKVLPVCTLIRHAVGYNNGGLDYEVCTMTFNKTSLSGPLPVVDNFKFQNWTLFDEPLGLSRVRFVYPSFTNTTRIKFFQLLHSMSARTGLKRDFFDSSSFSSSSSSSSSFFNHYPSTLEHRFLLVFSIFLRFAPFS